MAIGSIGALRDDDFVRAWNDVRTSPLVRIQPTGMSRSGHAVAIATIGDYFKAAVAAEDCG